MQNHIWARTILTSYRFLERITDAIDTIIEKKALASSWTMNTDGTLELADKIIELSERKVKLINLKLLTENALSKVDEKFARLLISRYFDKLTPEEIMNRYLLSRRSYFRHIQDAEASFESACATLGFPLSRLESYLESEEWIKQIKSSLRAKSECEKNAQLG